MRAYATPLEKLKILALKIEYLKKLPYFSV